MTYKMKCPDMIRTRDVSNIVIDGLLGGTMDIKAANAVTGAANNLIRSFSSDLKARLALPDLIDAEARLIEGGKTREPGAVEAKPAPALKSKA